MSYARFSEGDVYVIGTARGPDRTEAFECMACPFVETRWVDGEGFLGGRIESVTGEPTTYATVSRAEMVAHIQRHRDAGHDVPDRAFKRLAAETEWGQP